MNTRKVYLAAKRIVETFEAIDNRCLAADGPVSRTEEEWTQAEQDRIAQAMKQIARARS